MFLSFLKQETVQFEDAHHLEGGDNMAVQSKPHQAKDLNRSTDQKCQSSEE